MTKKELIENNKYLVEQLDKRRDKKKKLNQLYHNFTKIDEFHATEMRNFLLSLNTFISKIDFDDHYKVFEEVKTKWVNATQGLVELAGNIYKRECREHFG